jgi:exodeoxyribonuclease III
MTVRAVVQLVVVPVRTMEELQSGFIKDGQMKTISCNMNGIRAAYKKGLMDFINAEKPDILCLQEIKANESDFPDEMKNLDGYQLITNCAIKKGYSGVAVYTKRKPISVIHKLGLERFDSEGRILELDYGDFVLMNLYLPHGGRQKENLEYKLLVYEKLFERLGQLIGKNVILIGDFNIAHQEIDLSRPKQNINNTMFTPEERVQIDKLIELGFVDTFRMLNKEPGNYTWWPYAFNARERNMGWRIDYCFVSKGLAQNVKSAEICSKYRFSDHGGVGVELFGFGC